MDKDIKKNEMITIKFNARVIPKVKWNDKTNKFDVLAVQSNFRNEMLKLMTEEGTTPEETKKLQGMKTGMLIRNGMLSINEALNIINGDINDKTINQFYFKDDIVSLPKTEADYYLNSFCGGEIMIRNEKNQLVKSHHLMNIDGKARFYNKNELARFEREHVPMMVAEVYNG